MPGYKIIAMGRCPDDLTLEEFDAYLFKYDAWLVRMGFDQVLTYDSV